MEESSQNSEKNWLIRSSTRILGPYTIEEVTQLIALKQISIIDEIRSTTARWCYIRENKIFLELIKNIRHEQDNAIENTMTLTATLSNQTKTDAIHLNSKEELTPPPILSPDYTQRSKGEMKDIAFATETAAKPLGTSAKSFGTFKDEQTRQRIAQKTQFIKIAISATAALLLVLLVFLQFFRDQKKLNVSEDLSSQAIKYKNIGLYEKSLDFYKRIQLTKEPDFELQYQMAPLLISEDRQSLMGRRILEKAIVSQSRSRQDLLDSHIQIALSFMQEGDLKEAENYLQKAMTFEPSNKNALINLSIIQLKKGNYLVGARELDELSKKNVKSNFLTALRAIAWIEVSRNNIDTIALSNIYAGIQIATKIPSYLTQELSLLSLRIAGLLRDEKLQAEALINFLNQVPFKSIQFQRNLMYDWRILQWDYIEKYCSESFNDLKISSLQKAALSICLMEVNRDEEAQRYLKEALNEQPKNPQILTLYANFLAKMNRSSEAMTLLKNPDLENLSLAQQTSGQICMQQGQIECAKKAFQSLLNKESQNVFALYGLAWVALQEKQKKQAYDFASLGLQIDPNYLPLIDLRDRLDNQ